MASTDTPPDEVEDSSSSCGQSTKASKDNKKCCIAGNSLSPNALTDSYDDKFLCDNPADCDQCNDNSCDQGDCNCVDCACNHGNCNHGDSTQDNCAFTNGYGKGSAKRTISNSSDDNCFHLELEDKCEDIKKEETPQQTNDQTPQSTITQGSLSSQDPQVQSEPQAAIENGAKKKVEKRPRFSHQSSWKDAVKKAWSMTDPWAKFHIHDNCAMEIAVRHRYNAIKKSWVKDEIRIKMESVPFDQGAMRVCYRLKKLSNFSKHNNWKHASNYVAKSYIEEVSRDQYFEDVRLQMDAKLWGEEYNRRDPPKKVDIFQTYIIELKERTGSPLYHLEHFIEGTYKKYNSNSGFVLRDETLRCTPQAFSHFTFERSGHQLIVVDIQGVGDLYTDPQIHTADMKDYGEANFGPQGMALFFSSHKCNRICKTLGLTEFDISAVEDKRIDSAIQVIQDSSTVVKSSLEDQLSPRKMSAIFDLSEYCLGQSPPPSPGATEVSPRSSVSSCNGNPSMSDSETSETESDTDVFLSNISSEDDDDVKENYLSVHVHKASSVFAESEQLAQAREQQKEKLLRQKSVSVLGKVHLEMAKYGEIGRFTSDREPDMESAMFHMEKAAQCGITTALVTLAEIYLQLPHDLMESATVQETEENINKGVELMLQAAERGDRQAMLYMAKAYDTGYGLGTNMKRSWKEAVKWYQNAIDVIDEDDLPENTLLDDPVHTLLSRQAELYFTGGPELERDPQCAGDLFSSAGDEAMAAMKGKLANKYYTKAEEAWAEVEE